MASCEVFRECKLVGVRTVDTTPAPTWRSSSTSLKARALQGTSDRYVIARGLRFNRFMRTPGVILDVSAKPTSDAPTNIDVWI